MTTGSGGERSAERKVHAVVDRALAQLAEAWNPLTQDLNALAEQMGEAPGSEAAEEFARLEEEALVAGWWLAVLASARGGAALGARRRRQGLLGADRLVQRLLSGSGGVAATPAGGGLLIGALPELEPDGLEDGWRVPFAWLWFLDAAGRAGTAEVRVERRGEDCVVCADRIDEPQDLAAWVERNVPGASVELAPGTGSSQVCMILGRSLVRWPV